jgi:hypothetical protein
LLGRLKLYRLEFRLISILTGVRQPGNSWGFGLDLASLTVDR